MFDFRSIFSSVCSSRTVYFKALSRDASVNVDTDDLSIRLKRYIETLEVSAYESPTELIPDRIMPVMGVIIKRLLQQRTSLIFLSKLKPWKLKLSNCIFLRYSNSSNKSARFLLNNRWKLYIPQMDRTDIIVHRLYKYLVTFNGKRWQHQSHF